MTRGRSGHLGAVESKILIPPSLPILARWMSEEKTLWKKSKGEQASPFASAELSKLSANWDWHYLRLRQDSAYILNSFAHLGSSRKT